MFDPIDNATDHLHDAAFEDAVVRARTIRRARAEGAAYERQMAIATFGISERHAISQQKTDAIHRAEAIALGRERARQLNQEPVVPTTTASVIRTRTPPVVPTSAAPIFGRRGSLEFDADHASGPGFYHRVRR